MASPRSAGGTSLIRSPSIMRSPEVISSSPAIMRSKVDLQQPEGPTKTTNSRSSMSRSTPLMTSTSPKLLRRSRSVRVAMGSDSLRSLFDGAEGQAAHELLLAHPAEHQDRRDGHGRGGRQLGPEQPLRAREGGDEGGERSRAGGGEIEAPEGLVPGQDDRQQRGRGDPGQRQRHQEMEQLLLGLGTVHAAGLEDVLGHLLEEGVEHPDHDRQVDQREDHGQADAGIEQTETITLFEANLK